MPAGYLHRFDGGENIWRRDYHRCDVTYGGTGITGTTALIFNNTYDTDFLVSAAFLSGFNISALNKNIILLCSNAADVEQFRFLDLWFLNGHEVVGTISFPMPVEVKSGYKIKINVPINCTASGYVFGVQEDPA